MPVLLAVVGLCVAVLFFVVRARNAAGVASDLLDMAKDVRLAARRFGFRRRTDIHPAESIEDPSIAIAGIANAFLELDDLPTSTQRSALTRAMAETLNLARQDADELTILGRWMANECGTSQAAVSRLSRKLVRLAGRESFTPLLTILNATLTASSTSINTRQKEALDDVKRAFRIS
ncbi:hypothetical protein [Marimonas arenosa]|uniref:Tellurite resistance protein TerB n=1 Tax=Marimonas arenosa TaxID=1795305 RepID=A0AAE3WFD1_9RHOB|nr:hypothetical protein [Marimonas arenosa]MDQ2091508.1 hypothetical protein [Marimonas arenosa]